MINEAPERSRGIIVASRICPTFLSLHPGPSVPLHQVNNNAQRGCTCCVRACVYVVCQSAHARMCSCRVSETAPRHAWLSLWRVIEQDKMIILKLKVRVTGVEWWGDRQTGSQTDRDESGCFKICLLFYFLVVSKCGEVSLCFVNEAVLLSCSTLHNNHTKYN